MKERNYNTANRGSYAETLIDRTCQYYRNNHMAMIEKREVPIKILKRVNESTIVGKLMSKSYVDYFGCYQSKHFEFEVKQTNECNFSLDMIKPHQLEYLKECIDYGIESFVVVYFAAYDKFYKVSAIWIVNWLAHNKTKTIKYEIIEREWQGLEIKYPGIVGLI